MKITFGGKAVELKGKVLKVGDKLENFSAVNNDLSPFKLSDIKGRKLILAVPSLDTSVCDAEIRRFNTEATKFGDVTVIAVSMDLPFAQSRWCGAAGVDKVITVSDFKDRDFADKSGTYIKDVGLLARSVFLLDENNNVKYVEYVSEVTHHPNYQDALKAIQA
ncbi:MAG: thiol peroxidase [Sphaerochaetaceae bacterium]|nr:thiol peroxidase [Candidatus Cloacimonadota bacterium]